MQRPHRALCIRSVQTGHLARSQKPAASGRSGRPRFSRYADKAWVFLEAKQKPDWRTFVRTSSILPNRCLRAQSNLFTFSLFSGLFTISAQILGCFRFSFRQVDCIAAGSDAFHGCRLPCFSLFTPSQSARRFQTGSAVGRKALLI